MVSLRRALIAAVSIAAGCAGAGERMHAPSPDAPRVVASNILRADYAGTNACGDCHGEIAAEFARSPMHNMTRRIETASIQAPFDGSSFHFKGFTVTAETHDARRYIRVVTPNDNTILYRVTKVVGGRYREDFVGREVHGVEADAEAAGEAEVEPVLPVSWLIFAKTWRYKGYSVMSPERPRIERGAAWKQTCIFCHNTAPLLATLYDDLSGGGKSYQGSVSDKLLPDERVWRFAIGDDAGLERAVRREIELLGVEPPDNERAKGALDRAITATRQRFGEKDLLEVGIGCEACHNGAAEHVKDPTKLPSFEIESELVKVVAKEKPTKAAWINHTCARCHTVLFSRYPWTWEGGTRNGSAGGSTINSGEARDFLLGGCSNAMACTACHDPHGKDSRTKLDALATVAGNATCTSCHDKYRSQAALAEHSHHGPTSAGSACVACHMPKKNMGLSYKLTRYHRIGSPTDRARVENDRPLECALCHADKSVDTLASTMERWWKKSYDRGALRTLYGDDLSANALVATLLRGKAHEQAIAAVALADAEVKSAAPDIAPLLASEYPLVRYWGRAAIERLTKEPLAIDLDGDVDAIRAQADVWARAKRAMDAASTGGKRAGAR